MKRYAIDYGAVLDVLGEMFELFSRRDLGLILAGYRALPSERHSYQILRRLTKQELIVRRLGGEQAQFVLSDAAQRRIQRRCPAAQWRRSWDGRWRAIIYDLPELRRVERQRLWRGLRRRRVGLLPRSVWIWPHPVTEMMRELTAVGHVPECFCGLETDRLFLCTDAELVAAAWDWEGIEQRQRTYLGSASATPAQARKAGDLLALARMLRLERSAYDNAFGQDPLLPQVIWPKGYRGPAVARRHAEFVASVRRRWRQLAVLGR